MEQPEGDKTGTPGKASDMTAMADMLIVTHIPYYILVAALVAELWLLRRSLRQLARTFEEA